LLFGAAECRSVSEKCNSKTSSWNTLEVPSSIHSIHTPYIHTQTKRHPLYRTNSVYSREFALARFTLPSANAPKKKKRSPATPFSFPALQSVVRTGKQKAYYVWPVLDSYKYLYFLVIANMRLHLWDSAGTDPTTQRATYKILCAHSCVCEESSVLRRCYKFTNLFSVEPSSILNVEVVHSCDKLVNVHPNMALGLTQPLTEMSTRNISWAVKVAGA
jgi:hypothetical protein